MGSHGAAITTWVGCGLAAAILAARSFAFRIGHTSAMIPLWRNTFAVFRAETPSPIWLTW